MGFHIPSARSDSEVHLPRACLTRYVPPSGFGHPLGGLLPPSPSRFSFAPAALMGFTLRSFPLSQGIHASPRGRTHLPFLLPFLPVPKHRAGPAGRGFWALTLARVPGDRSGISAPTTGCSHGFHPSRVFHRKPWPSFRPASSHALAEPARRRARGAPESRSASGWSHPP
jgi:hypothetical protein